jgi:hypothetical protein
VQREFNLRRPRIDLKIRSPSRTAEFDGVAKEIRKHLDDSVMVN